MKFHVSYFCDNGKYKPVSTIIEPKTSYDFYKRKNYWIERAKQRIMAQRYWSENDMKNFGYTDCKIRIYKED